jgi:hypothetical protein
MAGTSALSAKGFITITDNQGTYLFSSKSDVYEYMEMFHVKSCHVLQVYLLKGEVLHLRHCSGPSN